MPLPLPVVPDPMRTTEGPVRPAAPSARLTVAEWLRFGPFLAQIVVARRCNLSCGYCNEYDDDSAPVPFETLDRRLLKLHQLRTWVVCLTGGEPTLHPELVRIVSRMRELGFRRRQLITNGYLLTPKLIDALNGAGLTDLQISVDGVERNATTVKVLDRLRGKLVEFGRDLETYSLDDLRQQFHTSKPCSDGCTVGCVRTASAYDGWRSQAG